MIIDERAPGRDIVELEVKKYNTKSMRNQIWKGL